MSPAGLPVNDPAAAPAEAVSCTEHQRMEDPPQLHTIISKWGSTVLADETGHPFEYWLERLAADYPAVRIINHNADDLDSSLASGSFRLDAAVIVPASMATVAALASGTVSNLVHRAGAVALKEGWPLAIAPRETPLSLIDLRNLERLAEAGAIIMPASPPFYGHPRSIDDLASAFAGKILDRIGMPNPFGSEWQGLDHSTE